MYKDWLFWVLFLIINLSGNLCFSYIFPYKIILLILSSVLLFYYSFYRQFFHYEVFVYLACWLIILLLQAFYTSSDYSFTSNFHFFLKIVIGVVLVYLLKNKFVDYYCEIIYVFSLISLPLFVYNCLGGIVPFISVDSTNLDDGNVFRVSSLIYTQLYNLSANEISLRNCGPFWEPGAFQGFVNLAICLNLLTYKEEDSKWRFRMVIYVVTVLTTFSTGGYILLIVNVIYYILRTNRISFENKFWLLLIVFVGSLCSFILIDFLGEKIYQDKGRLNVSLSDLGTGLYLLFGYGLSSSSILQSDIQSVSSIFNMFRYVGIVGFILYFLPVLWAKINTQSLYVFLCLFLILMNEPFITAGPFWWSIPLIFSNMMRFERKTI